MWIDLETFAWISQRLNQQTNYLFVFISGGMLIYTLYRIFFEGYVNKNYTTEKKLRDIPGYPVIPVDPPLHVIKLYTEGMRNLGPFCLEDIQPACYIFHFYGGDGKFSSFLLSKGMNMEFFFNRWIKLVMANWLDFGRIFGLVNCFP